MEGMLGVVTVPAITGITWVVCYIIQKWIKDDSRRIIPTIAAILGVVLELINVGFVGVTLDMILVGLVSGLAATGADQLVKQYKKDTTVNSDAEE